MRSYRHMLLQHAALLAALLMSAAAVFGIRTVPVYAENAGEAASEDAGDAASEDADAQEDPGDEDASHGDEESDPEEPLPVKYDPRPDGVSAVRNQIWGTCWAQAGISTFESYLIRQGLEDPDIQLSVEDPLWWARSSWMLRGRNDGAKPAAITGYFTTRGVRSEEDIPYLSEPSEEEAADIEFFGEGRNQQPENYNTAPVLYEVTDMIFFKDVEPGEIKKLILEYGAVSTMLYQTADLLNEETSATWAVYDEINASNHAVSVVGWDDEFPKENFKELDGRIPENDGAWLIKNSFGTDFGSDGGFNYVSYEDAYLFKEKDPLCFGYCIAGVREPEDMKVYLTDQYGAVSALELPEEETGVFANIYDFGEDEQLIDVSFVTWTKGGSYQAYYAPVKEDVPDADESSWTLLSEGDIEYAGYMTVSCEWDDPVPEGKGAVILVISGEVPSIGTEEPLHKDTRTLYNPQYDPGTAFMMKDGAFVPAEAERTLIDGFTYLEKPDLSIRAYTKKR